MLKCVQSWTYYQYVTCTVRTVRIRVRTYVHITGHMQCDRKIAARAGVACIESGVQGVAIM